MEEQFFLMEVFHQAADIKMTLQEMYPKEWNDIINKKVPKKRINEYLLKFVARLLREVKEGKRDEDDLGDGWSMVINMDEKYYKLRPDAYGFLFRLSDYGMQSIFGKGTSEYGNMLYTIEEVEKELKKVAKKLKIKLNI